jgi:hypothetical protein
LTPSPAVWAAVGLFAWSLLAIAVDAEGAPPVSVLVVLVLGIGLSAAQNRRMRTTGRLLLAFLAVIYATAELGAERALVPLAGIALAAVVAVLAIAELVRGRS